MNMDHNIPSGENIFYSAVCTLLIILLCYLIKTYWRRRQLVKNANQLPSLMLYPCHFFGHLFLVYNQRIHRRTTTVPGVSTHVYDFIGLIGYNYLFLRGNITNVWQMYLPFVTVYKADSVEMILNHSTELKKAWFYEFLHPWLGKGLLTSHDEKWKSRRKLLTPAFHFNIFKDFLPVFNKQSKILVNVLSSHTKDEFVDIAPIITKCSLDIICESILGKELHTQTQPTSPYVKAVIELTHSIFKRMQTPWYWNDFIFKMSPFGKRVLQNVKLVRDFTNRLISEKKKQKLEGKYQYGSATDGVEEDEFKRKKRALLDLLLEEHLENNSITEEEISEEVDTFTFEGHDTTSVSMSWVLYMIGLHPWVQDKIHHELDSIFDEDDRDATTEDLKNMKYLECVIKETLRLYPPVPGYGRMIRNDIEFQGHIVLKGATCLVFAYSLHRNPETFPNPEKFDPDRFTPENSTGRHAFACVPFSAGPRNCIGQRFALMEEKTVLSSILRKYQVRSLDPRDRVHPVSEVVLRSENGLRLQIRLRDQNFDFRSIYYYP